MSAPSSVQLYLRLLGYVRPYWRVYLGSIIAMAVVSATDPALPVLVKPLLDGVFVAKDMELMRWLPLAIVGVFLVRGAASFTADYCANWVGQKVVMDLRRHMFATLVRLPTVFYDATTSGSLISKFTFNVQQVTGAATSVVTVLVKDSLTVVGLLGWLLYLNWRLTLGAFIIGPVIVTIVRRFSQRLRKTSRGEQQAMADLNHVLEESIGCHRVVKVFGGQEYEIGRLERAVNRVRQFNMKTVIAAAASVPLTQIAAALAASVILYIVMAQAARDQVTVGGFVSFLGALLMLLPPLKRLTAVNATLQRGLAAAETVFEMIDEVPEPDGGRVEIGRARGDIEFRDLSFGYPRAEQLALDHVTLTIAAGETVALVGASGSGKTTLAHLLPRFYAPTAGKILLDGIDIVDLTLASLRANISLVSQDVVLFNDTVARNIGYGRLDSASQADIVAAAEAAHAMQFIHELPDGLQTFIGEDGVRLSGGQRQRLAIARAFLKDAPILILDEATSALDSESEQHVHEALVTLMRGRTTLVIAHRLSTIQNAHRIVVLERGHIAEVGRHDDLLARNGIYAKLYRMQYTREDALATA